MAFTYFFRDLQTLETIIEHLVKSTIGHRIIKIWDAGCAHGPEPYSIAILLAEHMGEFAFRNVRIIATDIDISNIFNKTIDEAVYPWEQVERIPRYLLERYFVPTAQEGYFQLIDKIRNRVTFIKHDLLSLKPVGNNFNLIVCKNVLLHFNQEQRIQVIQMFLDSLITNGLFATEQTQKMPAEFQDKFEQVVNHVQLFRKIG